MPTEIVAYTSSAVIALFAVASFGLALLTYRLNASTHNLHKSLTLPNIIAYVDLIDEDDIEPAYIVVIQNVGQYPALRVHVQMTIQEWRDGKKKDSPWDRYDGFSDSIVVLQPQDHRNYQLPTAVESYVVAVKVTASNCEQVDFRGAVGNDPSAFRDVVGETSADEIKFMLGANSMKDLGKPKSSRIEEAEAYLREEGDDPDRQ